ncbi:hypothetical protein AX15_003425 [Amanita polypyramis BW_CC]|nr:hypothetical protein AX15_003425 [Amanita polypyramis BW_CC]
MASPTPPALYSSRLFFHEKKVPFELVIVDLMKGAQKAPEFLEMQPFGQIPVIVSGMEILESRAISRYIATKYASQGTPLVPTELKAIARFEQAASIEVSNFDPYASGIAVEKILKN